jgi:hypothetical protein
LKNYLYEKKYGLFLFSFARSNLIGTTIAIAAILTILFQPVMKPVLMNQMKRPGAEVLH